MALSLGSKTLSQSGLTVWQHSLKIYFLVINIVGHVAKCPLLTVMSVAPNSKVIELASVRVIQNSWVSMIQGFQFIEFY